MKYLKGMLNLIFNYANGHYLYQKEAMDFIDNLNNNIADGDDDMKVVFVNSLKNALQNNAKANEVQAKIKGSQNSSNNLNLQANLFGGYQLNQQMNPIKNLKLNYYVATDSDVNDLEKVKEYIFEKVTTFDNTFSDIDVATKEHVVTVADDLEVYDDIVSNLKDSIDYFYKDIVDEKDIADIKNANVGKSIQRVKIGQKKLSYEEIMNHYASALKYEALKREVDRAFKMGNPGNIQGVNYLFKEEESTVRKEQYDVIATTLYSTGRVANPIYNIVKVDIKNNRTLKNIAAVLRNRLKLSANSLYFFEFEISQGRDDQLGFEPNVDNCILGDIVDDLKRCQYLTTFGFFVNDNVYTDELSDRTLNNKFTLVTFDGKLNKEAQIEYVKNRLTALGQEDLIQAIIEIIKYQSTQVEGLTTSTLEQYMEDLLKNKSEDKFKPVYKEATNDRLNGNALEKLMKMVGFTNLKNAVRDITNKKVYKRVKDSLLPATRQLNQWAGFERNNWILTGTPGTGKSSGAEMLEKVLYQEKIIQKDKIVKYTPSAIVSCDDEYDNPMENMSGAGKLINSFYEANGGVLIIDEIGHLSKIDKSILLQLMEDNKDKVAVILCGYESEAKALLEYNPGYRSRFTHIVNMEDYTVEELVQIFENKVKEKHFVLSKEAKELVAEKMNEAKLVPNFGQARFVESFADKAISAHSSIKLREFEKISEDKDASFADIKDEEIYTISKDDIEKVSLDEMLGEEYTRVKKYGNPQKELNSLIGCNSVKMAAKEFLAKIEIDAIKVKKKLLKKSEMNMHMVFYGAPGTAKTTIARLIGRILYNNGVIQTPTVTEVGAADLVAGYVGQTAMKTTAVFEKSKGGVLFIDEAYSLGNKAAGGFNEEAVNTIIKELENNRGETMVIFAGYKKPMEEFIKMNPGFKSRISRYIDFPDYSMDELVEIFDKLAKDEGYVYEKADTEKIHEIVRNYLEEKKKEDDFGNGRTCRTLLEEVVDKQSLRLIESAKKNYSDKDLTTLKLVDFNVKNADFYEKQRVAGFAI